MNDSRSNPGDAATSAPIPAAAPAASAPSVRAQSTLPTLTKIIATLGPASSDGAIIAKLVEAGASIFRLNFSHGDSQTHLATLHAVRSVADQMGRPLAVLGDLPGPKIRVGAVDERGILVPAGSIVILQRQPNIATPDSAPVRLSCTCPEVVDDVEPGQRLLIDDGAVRMLIVDKRRDEIECTVTAGGLITTGKGINLPDSHLKLPAITERDWPFVEWSIANQLDLLALSFVAGAQQVRRLAEGIAQIKSRLAMTTFRMPIIAKIERPAAVDDIASILEAADGIMVARGDLGVELDLARVPVIQKRLLAMAQTYGKPCIVATQMLQSMINSPTPTRAEASDVAGAIVDGADAVMLSGETAIGKYPVLAVDTMSRIARQTEEYLASGPAKATPPEKALESRYRTAALAHGVWTVAQDIAARFIVVWSQAGGGARYLSQMGFSVPIIAVSTDDRTLRQMQLLRGVTPVRMPLPEGPAQFTRMIDVYLQSSGWASDGDPCVIVLGGPLGRQGVTNSLAMHRVGDPDGGYARFSG